MPRPGTDVQLLDTPGTVSIASDNGTWFAAGLSDRGPVAPALIYSLNQFTNLYGTRQSYSVLYDCIEEFFREGGYRCYVARVVGPGATSGSLNLLDAGAAISLVVSAIGPGAWSNTIKVAVYTATGGFGIQVQDASGNVLEDSGPLANQATAVQWALGSNYIRLAVGASTNNPAVVAATAMSAGTDDRASITDTQWNTALASFSKDLGPGQISAPGQTSVARHTQLVTYARAYGRVALLDLVDSATQATLIANLPTYSSDTRFCAAFAPWVIIPGITTQATRTIPPSPMIAGMIAANDPTLGVDAASAGNNGVSNYAVGLTQVPWDDTTRAALNNAGVNVIRQMLGSVRNYGWRSLANPTTDQSWLDFGYARLFNDLVAEMNLIGENFMFAQIDGQQGSTVMAFHDALAGAMLQHFNDGDLFGDTPEQAFLVDTGPGVNTLQTIANLELHAVVQVKMTPFAEWIQIQVVKRQTTDVLQAA